ncbi:sulfite exporter TauE/SafE family protein [Paracoccus sp. Z330]|uniref:Probable membrane transporter protein n=1 Tax=Paracoccus onchidii TaxID=3017813 RepID=A0ABT4ZA51_9RHOB|nr:sulfite exporter TauE/SafE family protein [Paracoccus onchidii]MDB6176226.1 sulfite exporter TauE/SafE family protein [Paracoccus onchidii]
MNWPLFIAGAAAGGFINGLAGFGTALFALGFWLQFMPPQQAVAIIVVLSTVTGLQGLWIVRQAIFDNPRRLARFLLPAVPGIPMGIMILSSIDPASLKMFVACLLLVYGGYFSLKRNLPKFERPTPVTDVIVGFLGGVLGGAASLSGALPTMWCSMRPWPKAETRAVLQPFNVAVLGLTCVMLFFRGLYDTETLGFLAIALPVSLMSAQLGIAAFRRLADDSFRRLLIGLTFVSGASLLARELLI